MGKIMNFTGTVLKNLFSKPVTINYPAEPMEYPERSRGHIEIDIDDCVLCGLCSRSCPSGALTVDRAAGKWSIDRFDCVQCGYCVEKCPKSCRATRSRCRTRRWMCLRNRLPRRARTAPGMAPRHPVEIAPRPLEVEISPRRIWMCAYSVPSARESVRRRPLPWTGRRRNGSSTGTRVCPAVSVPRAARRNVYPWWIDWEI